MNSSGIKRGLASSAIAALAVTGLPFLASSASAASGDSLSVLSQAPIRQGNAAGGVITLKSSGNTITAGNLLVTDSSYGNPVAVDTTPGAKEISSAAFDVDVISVTLLDGVAGAPAGDKFPDGTYHYAVQTAVTTGTASKATFGLVEDADASGAVNASDPKTQVEVTPTGAPAAVDISTTQNPTAAGVATPFTVTVKDAAGNLTQLAGTEQIDVASTGAVISDAALDATDLATGTQSITATWAAGGSKTITATGNGTGATPATLTDSATESVIDQASISTDEFKFDTGADTWKDGVTAFGTPTQVRVDQNSVTFSFASKDTTVPADGPDDAGKLVLLTLDAPGGSAIRFNGKDANAESAGYLVIPVLLDSAGKGSTTVALSGVTAGSTWTFADQAGSMASTTVTMARAAAASVTSDAAVYVTKVGESTPVTVTVKDQFGNPIGAPAEVSLTRTAAPNAGTSARVPVDANGKATISLPDAGNTAGRAESFSINLFTDQFDGTGVDSDSVTPGVQPFAGGTINYTADGLGGDFGITGATSDATANVINPLWDSNTGGGAFGDDSLAITLAGGTANAPAKISVDNGALILTGAESKLTEGSSSETITLSGLGAGGFSVVGTKTGVVTVTVESAGRTKTAKLTVAQQAPADAVASARNVDVTAPEKAKAGEVAVFDVKVTDAFGNAVAGVDAEGAGSQLGYVVSGPGSVQSSDAVTNAGGVAHVNVILTDNANSALSLRAIGTGSQFGSAADKIGATAAPGLPVSVDSDTAKVDNVVNIAALQAAVDAAQAKVDAAQDALDAANDDLSVAKTEKQVAKQNVIAAKKDLKAAKKEHKGVKAAKAALRNAKGEFQIASAKVTAAKAKVARAEGRLADAQAVLEAAQQALEDAQNG